MIGSPMVEDPSRIAEATECRPGWTVDEKIEDGSAVPKSVGELVVGVPSPRGDHRQHQPSTLTEQILIEIVVALTDIERGVRYIEFNRAEAAGFEVDEERPNRCVEHVPWVRFAVKQSLGSAAATDPLTDAAECVEEEQASCGVECGCSIPIRDQMLCLLDAVEEARCGAGFE
jgi:hypothetical protein